MKEHTWILRPMHVTGEVKSRSERTHSTGRQKQKKKERVKGGIHASSSSSSSSSNKGPRGTMKRPSQKAGRGGVFLRESKENTACERRKRKHTTPCSCKGSKVFNILRNNKQQHSKISRHEGTGGESRTHTKRERERKSKRPYPRFHVGQPGPRTHRGAPPCPQGRLFRS